jgi:hypothetical protein
MHSCYSNYFQRSVAAIYFEVYLNHSDRIMTTEVVVDMYQKDFHLISEYDTNNILYNYEYTTEIY